MGFIRKTVWIVKVRILAAKQFGTPVHKFGEFFYRAGNFFCNSHRHLICGLEHNCHQRLISGKYLTWSSVNAGVTGRYTGGCILGNSNFCLDVQIFAGQKRCHDFCNTGRIKLCIPVFGIKDRFCIYIHENCSLGFHIWAFRPSVNGISVCRLSHLTGLAVRNWCGSDNRITIFIVSIGSRSTGSSACEQDPYAENACKDPTQGSFFHIFHNKIPFSDKSGREGYCSFENQ